jgi:methylmalonyl-CoA/ethylmalonyl-CoA epimerase
MIDDSGNSNLFIGMGEVVLAVRDVDAAAVRLGEIFDSSVDAEVIRPEEGIELKMRGVWIGEERIAIVGDLTGTGPLARSVEKRGEGVHEICVRTSNLERAIAHFKEKGVRLVSETPHVLRNYEWRGEIFSEVKIVFIHPASCYGVVVEVQEWQK